MRRCRPVALVLVVVLGFAFAAPVAAAPVDSPSGFVAEWRRLLDEVFAGWFPRPAAVPRREAAVLAAGMCIDPNGGVVPGPSCPAVPPPAALATGGDPALDR